MSKLAEAATCEDCGALSQDILEGRPCPSCVDLPTICADCSVELTLCNAGVDPDRIKYLGRDEWRNATYCMDCMDRYA